MMHSGGELLLLVALWGTLAQLLLGAPLLWGQLVEGILVSKVTFWCTIEKLYYCHGHYSLTQILLRALYVTLSRRALSVLY